METAPSDPSANSGREAVLVDLALQGGGENSLLGGRCKESVAVELGDHAAVNEALRQLDVLSHLA